MVKLLALVGATPEQQTLLVTQLTSSTLSQITPVEATACFIRQHLKSIEAIWVFKGTHNQKVFSQRQSLGTLVIPENVGVQDLCQDSFPQMLEVLKVWGETEE